MYRFTRPLLITLALLVLVGCGHRTVNVAADDAARSESAIEADEGQGEPLLFGIGVHIEPFGAIPSQLSGTTAPPQAGGPGPTNGSPSYHNSDLFQRHVEDINAVAAIVERHAGVLTVQAQSPFTTIAAESGATILADLQARGHEIGLHFHEDAHLGQNPEDLPVSTWCAVMQEELSFIGQAGVSDVRYWSGGNLYPGLLDAAACAGLSINSDYKNPKTQQTNLEVVGSVPWRPSGGPQAGDLSLFAQHDPDGSIVFLPEGLYDRTDFASMRRSADAGGDDAYFDFLKESLLRSVAEARPNRVNVFHFTLHPGEFRGLPGEPFAVIDRFLTEVVDPLVAEGKIRWATFSQMADAFAAWEAANPGIDPRSTTPPHTTTVHADVDPASYLTFAINVHDIRHVEESADTVVRLIDIFERHGVRGDFYLTAPIVQLYAEQRPDVIERLRTTGMTISYHVRPPHPLYGGFDRHLRGLSEQALEQALRDYETYRLDLETGGLLRDQPGGYQYVADTFGSPPVTASVPNERLRAAALPIFAALGAQATVIYHEAGTDPDEPFAWRSGLLVRPSDFSITRWAVGDKRVAFWWNMLDSPLASAYDPVHHLQEQTASWAGGRPPFVTALIHEDNFYRRGGTSWALSYYADAAMTTPLRPPYDLNAPDPSRARSAESQRLVWDAYERLVAYAAANLRVVTSEDLVALAREGEALNEDTAHTQQAAIIPGDAPGTWWVANPTSDASLWTQIFMPDDWSGDPLPALVLVPGGISGSSAFLQPPVTAQTLSDAGFAVVIFDPDGRGSSGGTEDYGGFIQQDGLAAVIRFAASLPQVDPGRIGVVSSSYGVTWATGALARYPDLPVRFLIDWEGPADRGDTRRWCESARERTGIWVDCASAEFWVQREALTFIADLRVPYQRIQSQRDHAQPHLEHALTLVNAAVRGSAPWVRLNDELPDQLFEPDKLPAMLPDSLDAQRAQVVIRYASELFDLVAD